MIRQKPTKPSVKLGDRIAYRSWIVTVTGYQYKADGYDEDGVIFSVPGDPLPWSGSFDHMERMTNRKFDRPAKTAKPSKSATTPEATSPEGQGQGMENIERIRIGMLRRSPKNVRKSNLADDREKLVADITTRGILQNLMGVRGTEDGQEVVFIHGGGRRMDALTYILEHGLTITVDGTEIAADQYAAPVRLFTSDDDAEEAEPQAGPPGRGR